MRHSAMQQLDLLVNHAEAKTEPPADAATLPALREVTPKADVSDFDSLISAAKSSGVLSGSLANTIECVFDCIDIAEEEIAAAKIRFPEIADEIHETFRFLRPTEPLEGLCDTLYRHHARELILRASADANLEPGTTAEVLGALSRLSLAGPPSREMTLLYMKLFGEIFPEQASEIFAGICPNDYELTRVAELESEFRRKLGTERDVRCS